jgi:hypothetical protein
MKKSDLGLSPTHLFSEIVLSNFKYIEEEVGWAFKKVLLSFFFGPPEVEHAWEARPRCGPIAISFY